MKVLAEVFLMVMKRKIHAYGVGTGRSGTTSMAGLFSSFYRSAHEPHQRESLAIIQASLKGIISERDFRKYIVYLDNKLQLEFNSSFLNYWQLNALVSEFPDAKFILTIRDCYSWLNSFIFGNGPMFINNNSRVLEEKRFLNVVFGKRVYQKTKEEWYLFDNGYYTLDDLLLYWAKINSGILAAVPKFRLLVVKTSEISNKIKEIADFVDISPQTLDVAKSCLHKSIKHPNMLSEVDKDYLFSKVNLYCKDLMDKFFPGFVYSFE